MGNERHQSRSSVSSIPEVQLIGTILDDDVATPLPSSIVMPRPQAPISQPYNRSTSAPPQLSLDGSAMMFVNGEAISPEDPRLSPAYYAYYYSQRPIDPRLPPPLLDYSSWSSASFPQPDAFKHMRLPTANTPKRHGVANPKGSAWAMEKSFGASMIQQDFPRTPSPLFPAGWMTQGQKIDPPSSPFNVSSFDMHILRSASADIEQLNVHMNNLNVGPKPASRPYHTQAYYSEPKDFTAFSLPVNDMATRHVHPQPIRQYWPSQNPIEDVSCHQHTDSRNSASKQNNYFRSPHNKKNKPPADTESSAKLASILHELRTNKHHHHIRLSDVISQELVAILATDQNGSRFIQMQLEQATKSQLQEMYEQLEQDTIRLSVDVFANYVIQKFFENGTQAQRRGLAGRMLGAILPLSMQMYGCRVVQKALEVIELDQQLKFAMELRGHIDKCVKDQNGNHVIQKCIEVLPPDAVALITNAFIGNVCSFSMHAYGCRVIQRLLEHCKEPRRQEQILNEIMFRISSLIVDQFGNYVIQNIIERGPPVYRDAIISEVKGHVCEFSRHKFASNVVEKCFAFGSEQDKETLVRETCGELPSNGCEPSQCPLVLMVKDPFGNYVVQKILCVVNSDQRNRLVDAMRMKIPNLRKIAFGKHIVATVARLTGIVM